MFIENEQLKQAIVDAGGFNGLATSLLRLGESLDITAVDEFGNADSTDVRLRYHEGNMYIYSGSSDYDQDHRGHWGASSVYADITLDDAKSIASDLIDQVDESMAMATS